MIKLVPGYSAAFVSSVLRFCPSYDIESDLPLAQIRIGSYPELSHIIHLSALNIL
jgi:hypothetical protein